MVGVSNDAVNFLNSAIGSKVAPRHIIMIVASIGIIVGATFSSGMMEVARKGIFVPDNFAFAEIMVIFLAVMITDIILLDFFNTFGMPTSTTVSIVFELLGAACAVALFKTLSEGGSLGTIVEYINISQALTIIAGIFLSVLVAFSVGVLVQYLSRALLSFQYERRLKGIGALWAGLALTAIGYFILIKGLKGASFVSDAAYAYVREHSVLILVLSFVVWSALLQLLLTLFKINVLRLVVLFGTFALAMAFAGNDLVNFIGVPIAGFESFLLWQNSGRDATDFTMEALNQPVRTSTILLLLAGLIMVVTLWLSKKARTVTETEVNLGRQDEGAERFAPNALARWLVRAALSGSRLLQAAIPQNWLTALDKRFRPLRQAMERNDRDSNPPAFDLVRASVNLTVASILISFATSVKLPLSTTYVSFMVAMGASLADRAWGRDSASYRVAGVLNVITGWLFTALIAFGCAFLFAALVYYFSIWAVAALLLLATGLIIRTFWLHKSRERENAAERSSLQAAETTGGAALLHETSDAAAASLVAVRKAYTEVVAALEGEDRRQLRRVRQDVAALRKQNDRLQRSLYRSLQRLRDRESSDGRLLLLIYELEQDLLLNATLVAEHSLDHVDNAHLPLQEFQVATLARLQQLIASYLSFIIDQLQAKEFGAAALDKLASDKQRIFAVIEDAIAQQVSGLQNGQISARNSKLFFALLLKTKNLTAIGARFVKILHRAREDSPRLLLKMENTGV